MYITDDMSLDNDVFTIDFSSKENHDNLEVGDRADVYGERLTIVDLEADEAE